MFCIGDRVVIVDHQTVSELHGNRWAPPGGEMDSFFGKTVTISEVFLHDQLDNDYYEDAVDYYKIKEDREGIRQSGWIWFPEMIAGLASTEEEAEPEDMQLYLSSLLSDAFR